MNLPLRRLRQLKIFLLAWLLALSGLTSTYSSADQSHRVENVLLIVSDDLRADVLGCYGDKITRTPNLDQFAKKALVFDRAYCQATWCAPSRTSFMRSRYQDKNGPTLGETLQAAGKTTA